MSKEPRTGGSGEVARDLLRATYGLRDKLQECRAPWHDQREFPEWYSGASSVRSPAEEAEAWIHVYRNRWAPVTKAFKDFESFALARGGNTSGSRDSRKDKRVVRTCQGI